MNRQLIMTAEKQCAIAAKVNLAPFPLFVWCSGANLVANAQNVVNEPISSAESNLTQLFLQLWHLFFCTLMADYQVKSSDPHRFVVTTEKEKVGELKYNHWYSFKSELLLTTGEEFQIEPKGFWGTTIELKKEGVVLLNFKMHWNGSIVIKSKLDNEILSFNLKHKGVFKTSFILQDEDEKVLLEIHPDFQWNKLDYNYKISTTDEFENISHNKVLLLTTVHCANYFMDMMSATLLTAM